MRNSMRNSMRWVLVLTIVLALPAIVGCFGRRSGGGEFNPVAVDPSLSTQEDATVRLSSRIKVADFQKPGSRQYSFRAPSAKSVHRLKPGVVAAGRRLRVSLLNASGADNLFITLDRMKVKPLNGSFINVPMVRREIDLLGADAMGRQIMEARLPAGTYSQIRYRVHSARLVVNGRSHDVFHPGNNLILIGRFQIKEGFDTEISLRFLGRFLRLGRRFLMTPVVRMSSTLVRSRVDPVITKGEVSGRIIDMVSGGPLSGVQVQLGDSVLRLSDSDGRYTFANVEQGEYALKFTRAGYLDLSFAATVLPGQISEINAEMHPEVIRSRAVSTGFFSRNYPISDAHGTFSEVCSEMPIKIDFVSLSFVRAELVFEGESYNAGAGRYDVFIDTKQQVSATANMGDWWTGFHATMGEHIGRYIAGVPAKRNAVDVTNFVRSNPSSVYFNAFRTADVLPISIQNIQLSIYYK